MPLSRHGVAGAALYLFSLELLQLPRLPMQTRAPVLLKHPAFLTHRIPCLARMQLGAIAFRDWSVQGAIPFSCWLSRLPVSSVPRLERRKHCTHRALERRSGLFVPSLSPSTPGDASIAFQRAHVTRLIARLCTAVRGGVGTFPGIPLESTPEPFPSATGRASWTQQAGFSPPHKL